jgi:hypothetical protein
VTAVTDTKQYDSTTSSAPTPTISSGSLASGDTANFTQAFSTATIGTGKTLTPSGSVSDGNSGNNYSVTFVNNTTGVITTKVLTVSGVTASPKTYDGTTTVTLNTASARAGRCRQWRHRALNGASATRVRQQERRHGQDRYDFRPTSGANAITPDPAQRSAGHQRTRTDHQRHRQ